LLLSHPYHHHHHHHHHHQSPADFTYPSSPKNEKSPLGRGVARSSNNTGRGGGGGGGEGVFASKDDEVDSELFFMYFSERELQLLTLPRGVRRVLERYVVDTVLVILYFILLTVSGIKSLRVAVKDLHVEANDDNALDVRKAQNAAQLLVAVAMCISLLVLFQLARYRGMLGIRDTPADIVSWQVS